MFKHDANTLSNASQKTKFVTNPETFCRFAQAAVNGILLNSMSWLQVSALIKHNNGIPVLDNINLTFGRPRRLAIAGETGSGKTTLLKIIAGLLQPDSGSVVLEGSRVLGPDEKLLPGDSRIAYLSQHFELRNNYKLADYLEMGSKVSESEAQRIYRLCRIDHLLQRKTDQLSGGERQRTALARLLTASPRLLLLDEPYSNLDAMQRQNLKSVIRDVAAALETACILVSHDPADVLSWAEEVSVLQRGKIVQQGPPEEIYHRPVSEYVGGLFGDYNLLPQAGGEAIFGLSNLAADELLFIRPENIQLKKESNSSAGIVSAVLFFGSYYQVEASFPQGKIIAKTKDYAFTIGDAVSAVVEAKNIWSLRKPET